VHIVIMGCGRVGSTLAHILEDRDNTVSVIDRDPEAFRRLRTSFKGDRVTGIGFDRAVLTQAFAWLNSASAAGSAGAAAAAGWAVGTFGAHGGFAVAAIATGVMAVLAVAGLRALRVPQQHAPATQSAE